MSDLSIRKTGETSAAIDVTVCRLGDFITAGSTEKVTIAFEDSDEIRQISAQLSQLKAKNFNGTVDVRFSASQKYSMDQSVWRDLADALFGFSLCMEIASLGI